MRNKWAVWFHYPYIYKNEVQYTTSKKYKFKTKFMAQLLNTVLKVYCYFKGKYYWTMFSYIPRFSIDTDLGIDYQDEGPWRSYQLVASGDNLVELLNDASIAEIDQDGGELNCYSLDDSANDVHSRAVSFITSVAKGQGP